MKIQASDEILKSQSPSPKRPAGDSRIGRFKSLLDQSLGGTQATDAASGTAAAGPLCPLSGIQFQPSVSNAAPASAAENLDGLIGSLESYQQKLADPNASLKDMGSLVEDLSQKDAQLARLADTVKDGNLKKMIDDARVVTTVELAKFNRGDYIPKTPA